MSQYSDSEILDLDDLEEICAFEEDFTLPNEDNKRRNEESDNISIRQGKGKGKGKKMSMLKKTKPKKTAL